MNTTENRFERLMAPLLAAGLGALLLSCHSGTPAAPEGTEIRVGCEFVDREVATGNFQAIIRAVVIDEESDVPQVGVGVYFRVKSGPGEMSNEGPIRTDNAGRAQSVLVGRGATGTNDVTVEVSSGAASSEITLDVTGCFSPDAIRPVADATVSPNPVRVGNAVTLDFSDSSDSDCPDGVPESWSITWDDGETDDGDFADDDRFQHTYDTAGSYDIELEVEDCQGLTDSVTVTLTVNT